MLQQLRRLLMDESGATAVEYALIAAAIGGVVVITAMALGVKVRGLYVTTESRMP